MDEDFERVWLTVRCGKCNEELEIAYAELIGGVDAFFKRGTSAPAERPGKFVDAAMYPRELRSIRDRLLPASGVGAGANTPYDEGPFTLAPLQVTVCELTDGDGTCYCTMLHHAGQKAFDGMCLTRRTDKAEAETEATEWREFLTLAIDAG